MLISAIGNIGSGKTLILAMFGSVLKLPIYSNFKLSYERYEPLSLIDLIDLPNNINVFIDEAYTWIESRSSASAINKYCSYIVFQSRKTSTNIFLTAQMFSTVDIRFRNQSNIIILCKAVGFQIINGIPKPEGFKYKIINRESGKSKTIYIDYFETTTYFKNYDTLEIIDPSEKEQLEFYLIVKNPDKLKEKTIRLSELIASDINGRPTHDSVKFACLINGVPLNYEPYLYIYLNGKINLGNNKLKKAKV